MTIDEIKQMVESDMAYNFLKDNEHLGRNIIFLTLGGSYAYGMNTETSDVDIRGCAINRKQDIIGMSNFEQFVEEKTDTVIYGFNKLVKLLLSCNPNTIEMLGCKPEHYIYVTPIGEHMIANRKMFLSRKAVNSFGGYATSQLRRLENALAKDRLPQDRREVHVLNSMQNAVNDFENQFVNFKNGSIKLSVGDSTREDLIKEIFADIHIDQCPVRDFKSMMNVLSNVLNSYDNMNARNHKKDNNHLNKHAAHLVRLYLMCIDILEKEDVVTYREKEHDLLMDIRRGKYQLKDGTYMPEFFDIVNELEKRMNYAKENTSLPNAPNMKRIEEFVMGVNAEAVNED